MMDADRYTFTRAWGTLSAGIGWAILIACPVVAGFAAETQSPLARIPNRGLLLAVAIVAGLVVGVLIGGALIVAGQRLRLAVDSLHVQAAMLERLDELTSQLLARAGATQRGGPSRFGGLAGE
jgi:hypothetical protein